jgi:uncharacterized phage protein gp47/JayE
MFDFPTLKRLLERSRSSFRANLKGTDAWLWPNNVYASAKVIAGGLFNAFNYLAYVSKQRFAWSSPDIESLREHGIEFNIPQKPAAPAQGDVVFTAVTNLTVDTGARLRRADGVEFLVSAGGVLATSGTLTVPVISATDGKANNTAGGMSLDIVSGVTSGGATAPTAVVHADGISLGADLEDMESYRQRILFRKRNPPHGGAAADYVFWAGQVPGVSFDADRPTVYVERLWKGPGSVRVFPLMYDLHEDGIPNGTDVERVREHIAALQPAGGGGGGGGRPPPRGDDRGAHSDPGRCDHPGPLAEHGGSPGRGPDRVEGRLPAALAPCRRRRLVRLDALPGISVLVLALLDLAGGRECERRAAA